MSRRPATTYRTVIDFTRGLADQIADVRAPRGDADQQGWDGETGHHVLAALAGMLERLVRRLPPGHEIRSREGSTAEIRAARRDRPLPQSVRRGPARRGGARQA